MKSERSNVKGDSERIGESRSEQVDSDLTGFQNLSGLEDYQPKLTVQTFQRDDAVTIEIKDNGSGIPDVMKDKILQPFFTTKKGMAGTGLGLSITNDIINAHGGNLEIHSNSGDGTRCVIHLDKRWGK